MKKSDILTGVGLGLGCIMMLWGMIAKSMTEVDFSQLKLFWDVASVIITIGGSYCAMLINYPLNKMKELFGVMISTFKMFEVSHIDLITQFSEISKKARRDGFIALEEDIESIEDPYMKSGLQMVIDGIEPEIIKETLELEINELESRNGENAEMLRAWGGYAPAFGMIGTLIGLIQMLANLTDSSQIASGMGKALITTFYGSIMANLFFNPMAANIAHKTDKEVAVKEFILEGILAVQSGVNPRIVEQKLLAYLSPAERKKFIETAAKSDEGAEE